MSDGGAAQFGDFFAVDAAPDLRPEAVRQAVERTAAALGADEPRVAASVWFLGAAARIVSPPFGAMVLSADADADADADAGHLYRDLVDAVAPLLESVAATYRVSTRVLWGNVASAVNGARIVVATARPDLATRASALAEAVLAGELLVHEWDRPFRRRTCCLYYRVPGGGLCGDCVLSAVPR